MSDKEPEKERTELRTPMEEHKRGLVYFLSMVGPSTRRKILQCNCIPIGSLSRLLKDKDFEQVRRGLWQLRERDFDGGPSVLLVSELGNKHRWHEFVKWADENNILLTGDSWLSYWSCWKTGYDSGQTNFEE